MKRFLFVFASLFLLVGCADNETVNIGTPQAVTAELKESEIESTETLVYVTPSGTKYHLEDCQYVNGKSVLTEYSIEDAEADGYKPCKVCNPND